MTDSTNSSPVEAVDPRGWWPDYRAVWRWHFYASLFCLPFVSILATSGALYLFKWEIEAWEERPFERVSDGPTQSADTLIRAALNTAPGGRFTGYELPATPTSAARVLVDVDGNGVRVFVDPATGTVTGSLAEGDRFMRFVKRIHGELLVGDRGSYIVELAASWTIVMILTGLWLWWPRKRTGWGGVLYPRLTGGSKQFWRDLHAVPGFWISGMALFLLLSGLPWSKFWGDYFKGVRRATGTAVARQEWSNTSSGDRTKPSTGADHSDHGGGGRRRGMSGPPVSDFAPVQRIVEVLEAKPLAPPVLVSPPKKEGGPWTVASQTANRPWRVTLEVDGATGQIMSEQGFADRHWIDQLVAIGIAAHEGQLFGWPNQLLGLLTAAGLTLLCASGLILWWRRRNPGELGAPPPGHPVRLSVPLMIVILGLGVALPLFGATLLGVLAVEHAILRRIPAWSKWLGLRTG